MARIPAANTQPEIFVRQLLHRMGFRFRLHDKKLPGKPDIVLPKYHALIEVQGCFWHAHQCHSFRWPKSHPEFWHQKLSRNVARDQENLAQLQKLGWKTLVVWECALKGKNKLSVSELAHTLKSWLINDLMSAEISGRSPTSSGVVDWS